MTSRQASWAFVAVIVAVLALAFMGVSQYPNKDKSTNADLKGWQLNLGRIPLSPDDSSKRAYALGDTIATLVDGKGNLTAKCVDGLNPNAVTIGEMFASGIGYKLTFHDAVERHNLRVGFTLNITVDSLSYDLAYFTAVAEVDSFRTD